MTEIKIGLTKEERNSIQEKFTRFAHSDCHHDFKSTQVSDLLNNIPLNTSLSSFERARRIAAINSENRTNVYDTLKGYLEALLTKLPKGVKKGWDEETLLLESITGLNDVAFKNELKTLFGLNENDTITKKGFEAVSSVYEKRQIINISDKNKRNYIIRAFPYKLRISDEENEDKHKKPPALVFKKVTGVNNVAFIFDASFMRLSKLKMPPGDTEEYNFLFIKSIENESDSANKIENIDPGSDKINIADARDIGNNSIFPNYNSDAQNANLFTKVGFQTERVGSVVNGTFEISPGNRVILSDLGEISNITNASQLAINKYVEYYGAPTEGQKAEICLHLLTKRAGDWCQALCLLDKTRLYDVEGETKSLDDLEKKEGYKIGVITHDRILLAYCLMIGVNCFFTMALSPGNAALVFFENALSSVGTDDDIRKVNKLRGAIIAEENKLKELEESYTEAKSKLAASIQSISLEEGKIQEYLEKLYIYYFKYCSYLDTETLITQIGGIKDDKITLENVKSYNSMYESLVNKINNLKQHNLAIDALDISPNIKYSITNLVTTIQNGKLLKQTTAFINFTETYIYPLKDLINEAKIGGPSSIPTRASLEASIPKNGKRRVPSLEENAKYVLVFLHELFKRQGGGVRKNDDNYALQLNEQFFKLRHRSIVALKNLSKEMSAPTGSETGNKFVGKIGEYISDRHGNKYSIIDDYIITEEDCNLFITDEDPCDYLLKSFPAAESYNIFVNRKTAKNTLKGDTYFEFMYMYLRFVLLHHDVLYNKALKLKDEFNSYNSEEYDIKNETRVLYLIDNINTLIDYQKNLTTIDPVNKFGEGRETAQYRAMNTVEKILHKLKEIRAKVFRSYKGSRLFTNKAYPAALDSYLQQETAKILATMKDVEKAKEYVDELKASEEETRSEVANILKDLYKITDISGEGVIDKYLKYEEGPAVAGGGLRKSRKHKTKAKRKLRKTKRSKKSGITQ